MEQKTIGIVGGGQLGRMLTDSAHRLGFKVIVLDPNSPSPAGQVADRQIIGGFKDRRKILELAKASDFLTFEIESADNKTLEEIVKKGKPVNPHTYDLIAPKARLKNHQNISVGVNPSPKILKIIKDKFEQKVFLREHDIPVADFALIQNENDVIKQGEIFSYPFLLKARFDAYDGRGNFLVRKKGDIKKAFIKLSGSPLYAEKFVPFKKELSVVSARDNFNNIYSFDVVETIHKNNICHIVNSPARVKPKIKTQAKKLAKKVLESLGGIGVFAVEMFLDKKGNILVNEIAPRVHNSGHHTIEAYSASQFDQHIRAISGMPLLKPKPNAKASVMINILGQRNGKANFRGENKIKNMKDVKVHIYGKMETRKERKMGHITATGKTLKEAERKAKIVHSHISI